jgi:hypothetical protein
MVMKHTIKKWKENGMVTLGDDGKTYCYEFLNGNQTIFTVMEFTKIFDGPDCYRWREVFAFLPVKTISGKYVWFRKVYKQRFWSLWGTGFHMEPVVEYAELFDLLKL